MMADSQQQAHLKSQDMRKLQYESHSMDEMALAPADTLPFLKGLHQNLGRHQRVNGQGKTDAGVMPEVEVEPPQVLCLQTQVNL